MIILYNIAFFISVISAYLLATRKGKNTPKKSPSVEPKIVSSSSLVKKGKITASDGMIFAFSCEGKEEKECLSLEQGKRLTERHDYGSFRLDVTLSKRGEITFFDIEHDHIVPQRIKIRTKKKSRVFLSENGYLVKNMDGSNCGFLVIGASAVELCESGLILTVSKRAIVALSQSVPSYSEIKKAKEQEAQPFFVYTPDKALNSFFNEWLWDIITEGKRSDFYSAVMLTIVRLCYGSDKGDDFVRSCFIEAGKSERKKAIALWLLCRWRKSFKESLLPEGSELLELVNSYLNRRIDLTLSKEDEMLRLCAMSEYYDVYEYEKKRELSIIIEREKEYFSIREESIACLRSRFIYEALSKESRLCRAIACGSDTLDQIRRFNPLCGGENIGFIDACTVFYVVIDRLLGARIEGDNYYFTPCFKKGWKRVDVKLRKGSSWVEVGLVSSSFNAVRVDGVDYCGDISKLAGRSRSKYEIYFK